jgi:DNA repair protein RadA/Sms
MKSSTIFECSKCGAQSPKWAGRCSECSSWGTLGEISNLKSQSSNKNTTPAAEPVDFSSVAAANVKRIPSGLSEVDRVLGGGIVPGSLILISGEPGIGKSTLLLQIASAISPNNNIILYNSGEESAEQIKMRFDRLGLTTNSVKYLGETDIDTICATIAAKKPALAIVDSIQTITTQEVDAPFGSVSQIKAVTAKLMETAKLNRIPIIVVGHITKDGDIAGPKTLEHMVDSVLYFEGERLSNYRILRAVKNRFGNTNEIGIFEMESAGLKEVSNPSAEFLAQKSDVSGSVLTCILGGNRPLLVEIQALTSPAAFGYPLRKSSGFDLNRLNIIAAIINQRTGVKCANHDIILNVAGGIKIQDPAADLAVALAIVSSVKNKVLPKNIAAMGELGLGGEIRAINQLPKRNEEARRLGITKTFSPETHKTLEQIINTI